MNRPLVVAALLSTAAVPAHGQACRGRLGFSGARLHADAGAATGDGTRSVSVGVTWGLPAALFVSAGAGYVARERDGFFRGDQTGHSLAASVGVALEADGEGRVEFCPLAGVARVSVSGDYVQTPFTLEQTSTRVGGALGLRIRASDGWTLAPFAALETVRYDGLLRGGGGAVGLAAGHYAPATIGVGALLRDRLSITGSLAFPFGIEGAGPSLQFLATFGLGRR